MKKLLSLFFVFLSCISVYAQKITSGSLDYLHKGDTIQVKIDYSKAKIMGMSDKDYAFFEEKWEPEGKKQQLLSYIKGLNEECNSYQFTATEGANATMTLYVLEFRVTRFAAECVGELVFDTKDGQIVMEKAGESQKAIGTKLHMMEKGIFEFGRLIGSKIRKRR